MTSTVVRVATRLRALRNAAATCCAAALRQGGRAFATTGAGHQNLAGNWGERRANNRSGSAEGGKPERGHSATPREVYGENAVFPNMIIGNFATRKPESLSYFTGNSKLYDLKQSVDDYFEGAKKLTRYPEIQYSEDFVRNYVFIDRDVMARQFDITLGQRDYVTIINKVKSVLHLSPLPPKFARFAQRFLTEASHESSTFNAQPLLDSDGVAHSWGTRKNAVVRCKMVEGTGEIRFNGKTLLEVYSTAPSLRETILQPLIATETLGKYNIWIEADMSCGGPSGRSEAARLAVAHGLALHRPELLNILDQLGWIKTDPRNKERKKPGQPKARKKKQWVKR